MMTELMAQGAQKRAERCDFLAYRRSHPHSDQHRIRRVISEKLEGPAFTNPQWSRRKHSDAAVRYSVEFGSSRKKLRAGKVDFRNLSSLHRQLYCVRNRRQLPVLRKIERCDPVAFQKTFAVRCARWSVCKHHVLTTPANLQRLG